MGNPTPVAATVRHGDRPVNPAHDRARRGAAWMARQGAYVFPLVPDEKRPAVRDWEHAASADVAYISAHWPRATTGYGVACGPSGLFVIDLDTRKPDTAPPPESAADAECGLDVLCLLTADRGVRLPERTFTVRTGRGGLHLYYRMPKGVQLGNSAGKLGWLIDTRGVGGYVVGPGSTVAGSAYEVLDWNAPAALPEWIVPLVGGSKTASQTESRPTAASVVRLAGTSVGPEWAAAALRGELGKLAAVPATGPGRNVTLNDAAYTLGRLVGGGLLDRARVASELLAATAGWWGLSHLNSAKDNGSAAHRDEPFSRAEAERTIRSGLAAGERNPRRPAPREQRRAAA